ncbi:secretion system protein D [Legionella gratiana]|uniref:HlyD family secretion protein n=1 Tax=Legionella gratiana TaxID=45066 RepID=A0A378J8F0_9GAMM|nr:NHLP bacteriocin system secretion protein [Legionella gratiana]KTD10663.1 secretion system protein D [Legionella gratiana]STX43646.1 HlyD family secretion protein [Legionella gratiana]
MSNNKGSIKFRKKALEHINNPVPLDDTLQVITLKNWLKFLVLILIIGGCLIWLIWGKLFIRTSGKGVLMSLSGDIETVQAAENAGFVQQINVRVGQHIPKDTILATINSDLATQLQLQENYLKKLKHEQQVLSKRADFVVKDLKAKQEEQIVKINASLQAAKEKLKQLEVLLILKEKAMKKGILDLPNVTETRIEYYRLLQEINSHEADLILMQSNLVELQDKWQERQKELALIIYKEEHEYQLIKKRWQQTNLVKSPTSGIIAEIRVKSGDYVQPGHPLISIIPTDQNLYALVFVPASKGKLIKPGMKAQIAPAMINKFEFGAIKGKVESISPLPVTPQMMLTLLKNQQMVNALLPEEPQLAVRVLLLKNPATPTGYQWTTSQGPLIHLTQGTLVDALFDVEVKKPINILMHLTFKSTVQDKIDESSKNEPKAR